ncbi:MAG TPA: hypothetical protein VN365_01065 [Candidatus Thermoplasmatota archaeon]|nr:hypothetical protein [Candidatus Thermoplasmatota archaeon]
MKIVIKVEAFFIIIALLISSVAISYPQTKKMYSVMTAKTFPHTDSSRVEIELRYYLEENLDQAIGIPAGPPPIIWQTAIRLTQDELAAYSDWIMTRVNVAFYGESGQSEIDVRIYIYEKGSTSTKPGPIIVNDTTAHLDTTGVTTIPLVTPVNLAGYEELWVAVEWTQSEPGPGLYYAWIDTLSGPHVPDKSDFVKTGIYWNQLHIILPEVDGRWGIGAIVEGTGLAELSIGNIKGPKGVTADISNIGENPANNVEWSITAKGGILKRVDACATGTTTTLEAGVVLPIALESFMGFGKINIVITATAQNALEVSTIKSAILLGPFVVIKR